ncbi:hypothetical protein [Aeromonas salmonicida]|uniref:hypothetical protein n=1 Tax=Aeromonas salmonicida TaxID=645 RepID=UPI0031FBF672
MQDSVKKILLDKLRKFLLPDFTNKLTWLFGVTGVSLIAMPAAISLAGKTTIVIFGFDIDIEVLSENTTMEGVVLCVLALIQNISYQIHKIIHEKLKNSRDIDNIKKEKDILEQKNEYLEAISPVNVVAQIKSLKELHEFQISSLKSEVESLREGINNDDIICRLESSVREKEAELESIKATMTMMSKQKSVVVGNNFVFGSTPFNYNGKKYLAGVINSMHMHFPLDHVLSVLGEVSSNPNAPLSKFPEEGKYVLTLNNEGAFKMMLSESELYDLRANILKVDANAA